MVTFSKHALLKLEQRKLDKSFVFATLEQPDYTQSSHNGRMVAFKKFRTLYMKVIFARKKDDVIVLTQYWVKKI
jgi:SOS response regulatory protein OraA/RecX